MQYNKMPERHLISVSDDRQWALRFVIVCFFSNLLLMQMGITKISMWLFDADKINFDRIRTFSI